MYNVYHSSILFINDETLSIHCSGLVFTTNIYINILQHRRVVFAITKHIEVGLVHTHVLIMARILLCV